jgi:N-acetylmuramoyl-L-alanine amidase-like protein
MGVWTDIATWRGPTKNVGGSVVRYLYVVLHIADGTFEGTIAWQKNPSSNVSSHFVVAKDGRIAQIVDTTWQAWTQIEGNPYSISIENEGFGGDALTPAQVESCAQLLARAHREHGIPVQVTSVVGTPGLGHHSMGYESGVNWGHQFCPGSAVKNQKPAIVARAIEILGGDVAGYAASQPEWEDDNIWRGSAFAHGAETIEGGRYVGTPHEGVKTLNAIKDAVAILPSIVDRLTAIEEKLGSAGGGAPTVEEIRDVVDQELDEQSRAGADDDPAPEPTPEPAPEPAEEPAPEPAEEPTL